MSGKNFKAQKNKTKKHINVILHTSLCLNCLFIRKR